MLSADKILEIIRLTGTKATALALASGVFIYFATNEWLGKLEPLTLQLFTFIFLLSAFLAIANFVTATLQFFAVKSRIAGFLQRRSECREFARYLPYSTEKEREIFGYLLANNQKIFTAAHDGGYASTLLAKGYVRIAIRGRQMVSAEDVPMEIPDHLWRILHDRKAEFPYEPPRRGESQAYPWRVHWMAR